MKNTVLLSILTMFSTSLFGQDIDTYFGKANTFFATYVSNGKVDYKRINSSPESLHELMDMAEGIKVSKGDEDIYKAFWINAYNIAVIKRVINNYPTKSPLDISGFFEKTTYKIAGKSITLNDIENKILRAQFNDARFHFVLVCGAIGCPPLINKAYLPQSLDDQLNTQTRLALNGDYFIKINHKKKRIEGSEILKWYKEDFIGEDKNEIDFINQYRTDKIPRDYKLGYFPYNWSLNQL
ncbi:DUF547 domain-containing protein [Geojedonia litorea]|uniref:DUF547 domain-containing protein n=1 Tax=Geojedonia litorea TaxID=1268269 RepID=A0ABV9N7K6_9FLAO